MTSVPKIDSRFKLCISNIRIIFYFVARNIIEIQSSLKTNPYL